MRKKEKPTSPLSINEVLLLCKICKSCGYAANGISSFRTATFCGVRVKGGSTNPMNDRKFITKCFQQQYSGIALEFEQSSLGNEITIYKLA